MTVLRRSTSPPPTGQGTGRHCFTAALGEEVNGEECGTTAAGRNRGPGCFFTRMVNCVRYGITRGGREASGAERCQDDASPRMFDSCSKEKHNSGSCRSGDDMNGPSVSLGGFRLCKQDSHSSRTPSQSTHFLQASLLTGPDKGPLPTGSTAEKG